MGTRETRYAARAADTIRREGEDVTLSGGETVRAIPDEDPENLRKEAPALLETAQGRVILLHVSGASYAKIAAVSGRPLLYDGENWTPHPARAIKADGVIIEVIIPCVSGAV